MWMLLAGTASADTLLTPSLGNANGHCIMGEFQGGLVAGDSGALPDIVCDAGYGPATVANLIPNTTGLTVSTDEPVPVDGSVPSHTSGRWSSTPGGGRVYMLNVYDRFGDLSQEVSVTLLDTPCGGKPVYKEVDISKITLEVKRPGAASFSSIPAGSLAAHASYVSDGHVGPGCRASQMAIGLPVVGSKYDDYPAETTFRLSVETPQTFRASFGGSSLEAPVLRTSTTGFSVTGKAATIRAPNDHSEDCHGPTTKGRFWNAAVLGAVTGSSDGTGEDQYPQRGSIMGSNALSTSGPYLLNGSMQMTVTGCGDGKPSTIDGFVNAFLSPESLDVAGVSQDLIVQADDLALGQIFALTDNGAVGGGATFGHELGQDGRVGVRLNYPTSFSRHVVKIQAAKQRVAWARKCVRLKAKIRRLRTGKKIFLTCKPRRGTALTLRTK